MHRQALSFKNMALFKRGVWLSAAALLAIVIAPAALNGELRSNPVPSFIAVSLFLAALVYFLWRTQAGLWSNVVAIAALALDLTERAQQARAIDELRIP